MIFVCGCGHSGTSLLAAMLGSHKDIYAINVETYCFTRIDLSDPRGAAKPIVLDEVQIASGFTTEPNGSALVLGPTGLAFDAKTGTLFVASTADNEIFAIPNAGTRTTDAGTEASPFRIRHISTDPSVWFWRRTAT